jgi:hypothetical protein
MIDPPRYAARVVGSEMLERFNPPGHVPGWFVQCRISGRNALPDLWDLLLPEGSPHRDRMQVTKRQADLLALIANDPGGCADIIDDLRAKLARVP